MFRYLLNCMYCQIIDKDEIKRSNSDETQPPDNEEYMYAPINENIRKNPFDTDSQFGQFIKNN